MAKEFPYQIDEFYLDLKEGEGNISMLSSEEIKRKPFPGLRPYKTSEYQLFKGRNGQAEELIKRLENRNLLAVIGSSGTEKSSLIRAGLIPQLLGGYLYKTGNIWDIAICRPGKNPIENLSIALSCTISKSMNKDNILNIHKEIWPKLDGSLYGILEVKDAMPRNKENKKHNLLIIIDQFEELFRFERNDLGKNEVEKHFVNMLLKATADPKSSVYVILTMRSEFLGDCVKYRQLPEAINDGQYLVPQLSRAQLKEVIEGPIQLSGKKISPGLVQLLINEIEDSKVNEKLDQLPLMQHALMRTYNEALSKGVDTEISYEHYKTVGGMEKALANHAEAKFNELGDGINEISLKQKIAKLIFQAITDMSADAKGGRRPTGLQNIYEIVEPLKAEGGMVDEVINHFRDNDTSFIMPQISTELNPNLMIDISHESLMRNWDLLNSWIVEEVNDGKLYKILNERRELFEQNKDGYIRGGLLSEIMERNANSHYNAAWASRYNPKSMQAATAESNNKIFTSNINFLLKSYSEHQAEKKREKEQFEESIKRASREKARKVVFLILGTGILVSLGFAVFGFYNAGRAEKYAKTIKIQTDSALVLTNTLRQKEAEQAMTRDSFLRNQYELAQYKSEFFAKKAQTEENIIAKDQQALSSVNQTMQNLQSNIQIQQAAQKKAQEEAQRREEEHQRREEELLKKQEAQNKKSSGINKITKGIGKGFKKLIKGDK